MSSILRISGEALEVDELLSQYPLPAYRIWKKGEPRIIKGKFHCDSGACFLVSDADFDDFSRQVADAIEFLNIHASSIAQMSSFSGVQDADLDFGVSIYQGHYTQFSYLPPKLIQLAASAGIGLEVSHYGCSNEDEES
ncbi:hypothetical protein [Undibacterium sp. Ren11W]|uniref:hypothetical protein n=1 Tax=Undibacterium sp. Ren11W TaxID=3413045 RepID=UPI003BEF83CA